MFSRNPINNAFLNVARAIDPSYVPPPPPPRQDNSASRFNASRTINDAFQGIADAVKVSARGGLVRDYAVRPSLGIVPDNIEFAKRGRKRKGGKGPKSKMSQKQNINIKINVGDKIARDDSVLLQRERKRQINSKMACGNVSRFSSPALQFGQPMPLGTIYNPRVSSLPRSDLHGVGVMPNPNQRVIQLNYDNKDQPQIQPVNPNEIEPMVKSMRAEPSTPTPNMDLARSLSQAGSSYDSPRVPDFGYNRGNLMEPRIAEQAVSSKPAFVPIVPYEDDEEDDDKENYEENDDVPGGPQYLRSLVEYDIDVINELPSGSGSGKSTKKEIRDILANYNIELSEQDYKKSILKVKHQAMQKLESLYAKDDTK